MKWFQQLAVGTSGAMFAALLAGCSDPGPNPLGSKDPIELPNASYIGAKKCVMCHEEEEARLKGSRHWVDGIPGSPEATAGCESCHGPGSLHIDAQADEGGASKPTLIVFGEGSPFPARQQNQACLACHQEEHRDWVQSPHAAADLACADCHKGHSGKMAPEHERGKYADVCLKCHESVGSQFRLAHHHPVPEGRMDCTGCHDPHGRSVREYSANEVNETCYKCHTEIRGPWVFEHAALREGCTTCHVPHGSSSTRMLKERDFNLCVRCHYQAQYYQANGHYSHRRATNVPVIGDKYALCYACHRAVHGSNFSKELRSK